MHKRWPHLVRIFGEVFPLHMRANVILSISVGAALMSGCAVNEGSRSVSQTRYESARYQRTSTTVSRNPFSRDYTPRERYSSRERLKNGYSERSSRARHSSMTSMSTASRFEEIQGSPKIEISLGSQQAYFYKGGQLVTTSPVSTGKPGFRTPKGSFKISQKLRVHRSNLYGQYVNRSTGAVVNDDADVRKDPKPKGAKFVGAVMPYWMRVNGGIGMHQGYTPGYPASHGCIRLPAQMAQLFYANAPVGTPVRITD